MSEFKRGLSAAALKIIEFIRRESESNYAPPMGRQQLMGRKPLFRTRRNGIGTPSPEPDSRRQERTSSPVLELGDYVFHPTAGSRAIFEASPATPKEEPSPILNDESPVMDFIDYAETTGLSQDIFADSQAPAVAPGGEEPSGDPQEGHRKSPQGGGHVFGETGSQVSPTVVGPPTASDRGQVSADQFLSLEIAGYSELVMSDCGLGDSPTDYPPGEGGSRYPEVSPSPHPENGGDTGSNRRVDLEKPLVASPRLVCCQEVDSTRYPYSSSALQPQERNAGIFNAPCLLVDSELALSGPQQNIGLGQATDEETLQLKTPGSYMRGTKLKSASQRANQPLVSVRGPVMTRDPRASQVREVPVDGGREQETTRRPYRLVSEYTNEGDANRAPRRIVLEPPPNRVKPCYGSRLETFSFRDLSHQGSGGEGEASFLRDQLQGTQRKKGRGLGRPRTTRDGGLNKITRYFEKVVKGSGKRTSPGNSPPEGEVAKKCRRSPQAKTLKEQNIEDDRNKHRVVKLTPSMVAEVERKMESTGVIEIGFTIYYREGFCSLNKPGGAAKSSTCTPRGVLAKVLYPDLESDYLYFEVDNHINLPDELRDLLLAMLSRQCRKVCFEAQSFIIMVIDIVRPADKRVCYDWTILDPMIGGWLLDPDKGSITFTQLYHSLAFSDQKSMDLTGLQNCCHLIDCQSKAMDRLIKKLFDHSLSDLFVNLETKITPIVAVMESWSIAVDIQKLKQIGTILTNQIKTLEEDAYRAAGHRFQLNSAVQLRKVLYEELKLDQNNNITVKVTPSQGAKSTAEPELRLLAEVHPLPGIVLRYRHLQKVKSTYVEGLFPHISKDGTISTLWEQCSAATGRVVSNNPNLQAIPKQPIQVDDRPEGLVLRGCFKGREGYNLVGADFRQIELRILAHLSNDRQLIAAFKRDEDIFVTLSQMRLGVDTVTKSERDKTKQLVYAQMYGASVNKLSGMMGVEVTKAKRLLNDFSRLFPCLASFKSEIVRQCRRQGWLSTLSGRRRIFTNINSQDFAARNHAERQAVNFIIQGSAADICKWAMVTSEERLRMIGCIRTKLLMQIHDELIWEVPTERTSAVVEVVKEAMEASSSHWGDKAKLKVALSVRVTYGADWEQINKD